MIEVLIIDDNLTRIREINAFIPNNLANIEHVTTKNDALRKLTESQYDLAIIDIMLPNTMSELNPNKSAGIELINPFKG